MDSDNIVQHIKSLVNFFHLLPDLHKGRTICPIHKDASNKTSFSVRSEDGQWAKCWNQACAFSEGGDIFHFIQIRDNCDFQQSLKTAADLKGIEVKVWEKFSYSQSEKDKMLFMHIAEIGMNTLLSSTEYMKQLTERGITKKNIIEDKIGYIGASGELTYKLGKLGYTYDDMRRIGLMPKNSSSQMFVHRFIFPYWYRKEIVYFIGRINRKMIPEKQDARKYIKLRKTDYNFHVVYGINSLHVHELDRIVITEGPFDYWAGRNLGWKCIAALGGEMSDEQKKFILPLIKKCKEVMICFDYDRAEAGQTAAYKLAKWFRVKGINCRILKLKPPDDYPPDTKSYDLNDAYVAHHAIDIDSAGSFDDEEIENIRDSQSQFTDLEDFLRMVYASSTTVQMEGIKEKLKTIAGIDKSTTNTILKAIKTVPEKIIAERIAKKHKIVFHKSHGFRLYDNGVWKTIADEAIENWIIEECSENVTGNQIKSIKKLIIPSVNISTVGDRNPFDLEKYRRKYIPLKNGFLNMKTWKIEGHIKEAMFTFQVNVEYDPDAECPRWIQFLKEISAGDHEMIDLLQEIFGYCFLPDNRFQKFFVFSGNGANGKTRFLEVIEDMLGDSASTISVSQLHDKFALVDLYGKLVNITTEDKGDLVDSSSALKAIVSGDTVRAERKYRDSFRFKPYCKIICGMNQIPMTKDTSFGFFRRIQIVDWPVKFVDENDEDGVNPPYVLSKDIHLAPKLNKELQGIFNWAIEGLKRLMKNNKFTISEKQVQRQKDYQTEVDYVFRFFSEMIDEETIVKDYEYERPWLYSIYNDWCVQNGHKPLSSSWFYRNENCRKIIGEATDVIKKRDEEGRFKRYVRINFN